MAVPTELLEQVMALDDASRAELAHHLLVSIDPDWPVKDPGYDEAWAAEIEARVKTLEEGRTELIPWEEVRDRLKNRRDGAVGS